MSEVDDILDGLHQMIVDLRALDRDKETKIAELNARLDETRAMLVRAMATPKIQATLPVSRLSPTGKTGSQDPRPVQCAKCPNIFMGQARSRYCQECAPIVRREQSRHAVTRHRRRQAEADAAHDAVDTEEADLDPGQEPTNQ